MTYYNQIDPRDNIDIGSAHLTAYRAWIARWSWGMTTDKQRALAAIEALNKARDLLEGSSDYAQLAIADEVADIVLQLKKLNFFGRPLVQS